MSSISFGSVCSGIEAASVAWEPLGWAASWLAEIEPFPAAVLKHHYPDTPNHGDMTKLPEMVLRGEIEAPDVLVGGTPCQSFSVAGLRAGLSDDRGQLTIKFVELADAVDNIRQRAGKDESIIVWENVPGVLSAKDNAFGCFLAALAGESCELQPTGGKWSNAGYILGPKRAIAWRILDAQYFGVAQRRRRVFVVASARDGFCPAEILFEFDGVRRDIAPSREAGKEATGNAGAGTKTASGEWPADIASTLNASFGSKLGLENQHIDGGAPLFVPAKAFGIPGNWIGRKPESGGNSTQFMHEIAPNQTATDRHGVVAFAQNTRDEVRFIGGDGQVAGALSANPGMKQTTYLAFNSRQDPVSGEIAGALDTCSPQAQAVVFGIDEEVNITENGFGPLLRGGQGGTRQAVATVYPINTMTMLGRPSDDLKPRMGLGTGKENDPQNTLSAAHCHAVAIGAFKAGQGAAAGSIGFSEYLSPTLTSAASGSNRTPALLYEAAVRRLTPIECERLQGFPDGYTAIPWRNKPAEECPNGHRYKALGNSMAVPVMRWIGRRIELEITKGATA